MLFGMKEHPETGVLLYPGDIFEIDENAIMKPPEFGGWLQRDKDPATLKGDEKANWVLVCARKVPDAVPEGFVMRDEPSKILGINISETEYLRGERAGEQLADSNRMPPQPVARVRQRAARR
jgi:hypothetical protein